MSSGAGAADRRHPPRGQAQMPVPPAAPPQRPGNLFSCGLGRTDGDTLAGAHFSNDEMHIGERVGPRAFFSIERVAAVAAGALVTDP
jgi:hypothetical protein